MYHTNLTSHHRAPSLGRNMNSERVWKHFLLAFLLALVGYAVFYGAIEHRRTRKGPWEVTFTQDAGGVPSILANQPKLGITNVLIRFTGELPLTTNAVGTLVFSQPRQVPYDVPFGRCIFMDTTFLPGTVTFQLFGHEIELLPRVLIIDHAEHSWRSGAVITLPALRRGS